MSADRDAASLLTRPPTRQAATAPPADAHAVAPAARGSGRIGRVLREPLVQFLALGTLLFAVDAALHPPAKDEKLIVVKKALRQSFVENFDEDKARVPSTTELQRMVDAWVASEILYREGKALGVDKGDDMIRDRIAYKLQLLIFDQIKVAPPTAAELRSWFAQNHQRFDEPERVGFYYTPATDEAAARAELAEIRAGRESEELRRRTLAVLARPVPAIAPAFGERFRDGLLALPVGEWSVLQAIDGWHVVRLDSRRPGTTARLEDVQAEAARLWRTDETRRRAWEAVNRLKASYRVRYEP